VDKGPRHPSGSRLDGVASAASKLDVRVDGWQIGAGLPPCKRTTFFFYPFLFVSVGKFALLELEKMTDQ
jgi:hypothetical protein